MDGIRKIEQDTIQEKALRGSDAGEFRCPECGKLILIGDIKAGSKITTRCRNSRCKYHHKDLTKIFM